MSQFSGSSFGRYSRTYLLVMGGIFLIVGVAVVLALGGTPDAGGAMLLLGGIFATVGAVLVLAGLVIGRRAAATDQLLASGLTGTATITGLTQTGMYLNDQPQVSIDLLVTLPGKAPYAAKHHEFVPLILLGRLTSGAPLAVRVDPVDQQRLAIDWSGAGLATADAAAVPPTVGEPAGAASTTPGSTVDESLTQVRSALSASGVQGVAAPFTSAEQGNYTVEQLRAYLRASGVPAVATVDTLQDTGQIQGDERVYVTEMTLTVAGQPPRKLPRSAAMVPMTQAYKLKQGMSVPVRYAAENPDLLMVEWDKI